MLHTVLLPVIFFKTLLRYITSKLAPTDIKHYIVFCIISLLYIVLSRILLGI